MRELRLFVALGQRPCCRSDRFALRAMRVVCKSLLIAEDIARRTHGWQRKSCRAQPRRTQRDTHAGPLRLAAAQLGVAQSHIFLSAKRVQIFG
jgi:hypothetical protein